MATKILLLLSLTLAGCSDMQRAINERGGKCVAVDLEPGRKFEGAMGFNMIWYITRVRRPGEPIEVHQIRMEGDRACITVVEH